MGGHETDRGQPGAYEARYHDIVPDERIVFTYDLSLGLADAGGTFDQERPDPGLNPVQESVDRRQLLVATDEPTRSGHGQNSGPDGRLPSS